MNQLNEIIEIVDSILVFEDTQFCFNLSHKNVVVWIAKMNPDVQIRGFQKGGANYIEIHYKPVFLFSNWG